jgi:hypothetical protein
MARRQIVLGVRRWVLVATVLTAASAGIGTAVAKWHNRPIVTIVEAPPPIPPCADDAWLAYGQIYKQCDSRARLEVYPEPDSRWTLIKCICRR